MALVEWGDAAGPVLGDGALSLRLEPTADDDRDDDDRRTLTVTAAGPGWDDRWDGLAAALAPWAVAVNLLAIETATDLVGAALVTRRRRRGGARPRRRPGPRRAAGPGHRGGLRAVGLHARRRGRAWPSTSVPDLFTGLRVGVATAKALGQALGRRCPRGVAASTSWPPGRVEAAPGRTGRRAVVVGGRRPSGRGVRLGLRVREPDGGAGDGPEPGRPCAPTVRRRCRPPTWAPGATPWPTDGPRAGGRRRCRALPRPAGAHVPDSTSGWPARWRRRPPPVLARLAARRLAAGGGVPDAPATWCPTTGAPPTPGSTGSSAPRRRSAAPPARATRPVSAARPGRTTAPVVVAPPCGPGPARRPPDRGRGLRPALVAPPVRGGARPAHVPGLPGRLGRAPSWWASPARCPSTTRPT